MFSWYQDSRSPHNWLKTLLETNEEDGVLSFSSIQAFSMIYFPKMQRQWSLVPKGAVFYTRALRALPSQLEDPVAALSDDVLLAIICMGMYEVVMFDQPTGWLLHYKGLARLAAIRGPRRHQSGSGFAMLPTMRYCITAGYLVERKRCFLGNSEWKAISWMKVGLDSKTPLDKLHDIFCDVPGFLEDRDRLDSWMPNTPVLLELAGLKMAVSTSTPSNDPLLPMEGTRYDVVIEICRMVDFHAHCLRRNNGTFLLIFTLNAAYIHLDGDQDGARPWLERPCPFLRTRMGLSLGGGRIYLVSRLRWVFFVY
ncbi:hypothetical protein N7532_006047 [Penicillium argentinense]|uniref:Uncharacterized protein n=1 Tax=Penicillium argentinense TaxID=1131581 RepID=A0A9W9KAZ9_9EURO|nr:uncharacterized protein N7532_006047 [Penicillium argentinense]KAJ5099046.1 hypothetical protein N7532_006047 [Penicillium argentinense]